MQAQIITPHQILTFPILSISIEKEREREREMESVIRCYPSHNLDNEISNFIKVWTSVILSLSYCYFSLSITSKPIPRLFFYTPVITLFLILPLNLHSMHLGGLSAFFIAWLANFKLILLAFNKGPLSHPSLSLPKFVATACFPIKIRLKSDREVTGKGRKSVWNYGVKALFVALFVNIYGYGEKIQPKVISVIYCFHIYFMLELMLATVAAVARAALNVELEPQFNDPYLSTSLQDFWGRRWNIMVSRTLRPTVYNPTLKLLSTTLVGRKWAPLWAVFATFFVSALMHELVFYYLGRTRPTWMITWFFMLHAVSLMVEIAVKKYMDDRWRLPAAVATPMTVGYVMVTGLWLFMPELLALKADVRAFDEYARLGLFAREVVGGAIVKIKGLNVTKV